MNKLTVVFPGTFDPPTYGHLVIIKEAAEIFPCGVTIMSSENPDKDKWFSQRERANLWQAYDLPANIRVSTLEQMKAEQVDFTQLVMIRGIRNGDDFLHEQKVMDFNFGKYGINKYFFLMTQGKIRELSSSKARLAATELRLGDLAECVAPEIARLMLKRVFSKKFTDSLDKKKRKETEMLDQLRRTMKRRFTILCHRLSESHGVKIDVEKWWQTLDNHYSEAHRFYHDWRHIFDCLREFDEVAEHFEFPLSAELGLFFHDSIYSVEQDKMKNNEAESAGLLVAFCTESGIPDGVKCRAMIAVCCSDHNLKRLPSMSEDEKLICGIDLAVLGRASAGYMRYAWEIRQEHKNVPLDTYRTERAKILTSFLARDRLYLPDCLHDEYEAMARLNVEAEIKLLEDNMFPQN